MSADSSPGTSCRTRTKRVKAAEEKEKEKAKIRGKTKEKETFPAAKEERKMVGDYQKKKEN